MRKRMAKFLSLFLTAVMVCSLLSVSALAALESHEQQTCKFQILYVDSSFGAGYSYGISWDEPYTCQYSEGHSGYNHSIACSKIREQVETAKAKVDSGWEIVGWAKEAKPNPTVLTTTPAQLPRRQPIPFTLWRSGPPRQRGPTLLPITPMAAAAHLRHRQQKAVPARPHLRFPPVCRLGMTIPF